MAVDMLATFQEWKQNFIAEIESLPDTVAKGDAFVYKFLQIYYNLSEEDAIDKTMITPTLLLYKGNIVLRALIWISMLKHKSFFSL